MLEAMRFTVKLMTATGEVLFRDLEAASEEDVRTRILAEQSFPLEITRAAGALRRGRTLSSESLIVFNQELLALLRAGIPLLQCLELLKGHGKDADLRGALEQVVELLREGMAFSEALEQVGAFPPVYRANIVAGERSGSLPEVIARWLAFQQFAQKSRRRILEALAYPAFLVVVIVAALAVVFNVVLPRFNDIYKDGSVDMPTATRVLLSLGTFFRETLWLQGLALVALVLVGRWLFTTERGRQTWERILLALPRFGNLYRMFHSSVFARTLAVLLGGGLPVLQALEVIQRTTASARLRSRLLAVIEAVRAGSSLHLALEQSKVLDPLAIEMARVGEQSSALPEMLEHVADFFDQEVEKATAAVTSLIGPVMILFMGVMVLGLLLAVYMPLFNASQAGQ